MANRAIRESQSTIPMLPTDDYKPRKRKRKPKRQRKLQRTTPETYQQLKVAREGLKERKEKRKTTSPLILDYFKMWKNMYNRLPTLTEITNSEGRPLTVDEESTFNEEYARRTQE